MSGSSLVTRKGQITIPAEIRRALGIHEGDRVTLVVEDGGARLERSVGVITRTRGILKSNLPPMQADELRLATEAAIVADVLERMSQE